MSTLKYISKTLFSNYLELEIWEPKRTLKVSPRPCLPSRRVLDPFIDKGQMYRGPDDIYNFEDQEVPKEVLIKTI